MPRYNRKKSSSCQLSPLSMGDSSPPNPPVDPSHNIDDNSLLSVLASPHSSFENKDAPYNVTYSWSGGIPALGVSGSGSGSESGAGGGGVRNSNSEAEERGEEMGQEVTAVTAHNAHALRQTQQDNDEVVATRELMYGTTPRASGRSSSTINNKNNNNNNNRNNNVCVASPTMHNGTSSFNRNVFAENTPKAFNGNSSKANEVDDNHLATPSWDIDQTFSLRKNKKKPKKKAQQAQAQSRVTAKPQSRVTAEPQSHQKTHSKSQRSQSSFSMIWDMVSVGIGLSRSESMSVAASFVEETGEGEEEEGATIPRGDGSNEGEEEVDEPLGLPESMENDLFAQEVGLMFSVDEGDTINDPSTLYSENFSNSFTIESDNMSAQHPSAYDLAKYLKHKCWNNGVNNNPYNNNATTTSGEDESTLYTKDTSGQSMFRDDHGNKVPENQKMILGYEHVERKKKAANNGNFSKQQPKNNSEAFPTIQKADSATAHPEEMERRLRELAGRISADWRGSPLMPPALARRLRDFQFAREKRRKKYGKAKPWGILGLYDHLSGVKIDVEWAEDAAWRRNNKQPYLTWCDFEATKNVGTNRPLFTILIVSACTALMFTSIFVNGWNFEPLSVNPMIGPSAETLVMLGAKDSYLIVVQQEIWRLVSPMVLHAGLIHFFLNMFALWFIGKAIEQIHGFFPAVVAFVVPAMGGAILSAIFLPEYITVGASGGIFGLIGACMADITMNWNLLFNEFVNERGARLSHARVLFVLFVDIVVNCLIGLTPFVDNFTHLGGMIYGFLCGLSTIQLVSPRFFGNNGNKCKLLLFRSVGLFVCMAGIIVSSAVLFSGDGLTNPCVSCTYMSCVSFPPWEGKNEKWWYCDQCSRASAEGTVDRATGKFIELSISCPNGSTETVGVDDLWPQDELGLQEILPTLCREHCIW